MLIKAIPKKFYFAPAVWGKAAGGGSLGLQTSLGSFFSLDNTLADSTGNVTNLTNNNTVTFVSPPGGGLAAVTNCANFVAASSQYLSHADATGINTAGIDFSLQFWWYTTGNSRPFCAKTSGSFGSREYQFDYGFGTGAANPITAAVNNGTALVTGNVANSAWSHFLFTRDNTTNAQIIYINGASFASNTGSTDGSGTSQLNIGADGAASSFWNGNVALFATWRSRIINSTEAAQLYNSGNGLSYAAMA